MPKIAALLLTLMVLTVCSVPTPHHAFAPVTPRRRRGQPATPRPSVRTARSRLPVTGRVRARGTVGSGSGGGEAFADWLAV